MKATDALQKYGLTDKKLKKATMADFEFHAEPFEVYCELEKYKLDKDGNKIIENDEMLKEKVVVINTMRE